jgi:hypothetical protein
MGLIRVFLVLGLLLLVAPLCRAQGSNISNCGAPAGSSTTLDSGKITAYCGIPATTNTACSAGVPYSYGSSPFASFSNAFPPCRDLYVNTADGYPNSNLTLIIGPAGGNATDGTDWCEGWFASNGSEPPFAYELIDGSAFAGTAAAGKHVNIVCAETQSWPILPINAANSVGGNTISLVNAAAHFWPTGTPYTLICGSTNQESFSVASTQSPFPSPSTNPFIVTIGGTWSYAHAAGDYCWAQDSNGQGSPSYPAYFKWTVCDLERLKADLNAHVSNSKLYAYWGISGTAESGPNWMAYGDGIANMAAPEGCGFSSLDTSGAVIVAQLASGLPDAGIGTVTSDFNGVSQNGCAGTTITGGGTINWSYLIGAIVGSTTYNNGNGSATVPTSPVTFSNGVVNSTAQNAVFQLGRNVSWAGCIPGFSTGCYYPMNAFLGIVDFEGAQNDNGNPCMETAAYNASAPGNPPGVVVAGAGHGASWQYSAGSSTNCGSSASNGSMCANSTVALNFINDLVNAIAPVRGNVAFSGAGVSR